MILLQEITPTVFIVDDDDAMRESLHELVSAMRLESRCFDSAESFIKGFSSDVVGCVILDVHMPGMSGIELHDYLIENNSQLPVIIVTGHGDISMCAESMKKGAVEFLEKPYRPSELQTKIRNAVGVAGRRYQERKKHREMHERFSSLNAEERSILKGTVSGRLNKEIAEELDICSRTVQMRRKSLMNKLGVESRIELIRLVATHFATENKGHR